MKLYRSKRAFRLTAFAAAVFMIFTAMFWHVDAYAADARAPICNITYDFGGGKTYTITSDVAQTMCVTAADGSYYVDPSTGKFVVDPWKVLTFLQQLQPKYPQSSSQLVFNATRGETVIVTGGTQNLRYFDINSELNYLYNAITTGKSEVHTPSYGVGSTYIEVDMTTQNLYYYQNGVKVFETPVVTGNTANDHGTPTGVYYVNNKSTNTRLIGADYVSFVYYWMPILGNSIGIHDATWRSSFGGNIYTYNGSHGCINVPLEAMKQLYPMVSVGTPTVVFY